MIANSEGYEVLAQSLSPHQRRALQIVKGCQQIEPAKIRSEELVVLRELGLIRLEQSGEREMIELTQKGRKVGEFV